MKTEREDKMKQFLNKLTAPITKKDREEVKNKFKNKNPHRNLHNFHTIKWLRSRFNENVYKRSINTMLPNNGLPVEDPDHEPDRLEKAKEFLENFCQAPDKYKNFEIPPKYFYSTLVMTKIKKLLDIFLEFDEDGSRKLEIGEMVIMFNTNNIPVEEEELVGLFFKDKKLKKDEEPYLDFYQFMLFALSKACDQDFRSFMRKLKKKKSEENKTKKTQTSEGKSKEEGDDEEDENLFLPMNFNLVLDYFNNKGKQRASEEKIKDAINIMNKIITSGTSSQTNMEGANAVNKDTEDNKTSESEEESSNEEKKIDPENLNIHDEIDTQQIFEEFKNLFEQKHASENSNNSNRIARRILGLNTESEGPSRGVSGVISRLNTQMGKILPTHISTIQTRTINSERSRSVQPEMDQQYQYNNPNIQLQYSNYLRSRLDANEVEKTSIKMYEKYKSVYLAAEETKKKRELNKVSTPSSTHYSNFKSTGYATGFNFNKVKNTKFGTTGQNFNNNNYLDSNPNLNANNYFTQTGNAFYNNNPPLISSANRKGFKNKIESARSRFSQNSALSNNSSLPDILTRKIKNQDYIPLKLLKELDPHNNTGSMHNNTNNLSRNSNSKK